MHRIDWIGSQLAGISAVTEPLFQDGWGEDVALVREELTQIPIPSGMIFEQKAPQSLADRVVTDFRFRSPYPRLPESSRYAYLRLFEPPSANRVVLLMAAFNEHGYETRQAFADYLLNQNVAVAILENPYYGLRRPNGGQPLRTAADLLKMGIGAVWDGVEITDWLRQRGSWTVGVAGYSMGANTAALVAAVSQHPLACAALAASPSPGPVFAGGALGASVDWKALGGPSARSELGALFGEASVLRFPAPPHSEAAVILGILQDGYVMPEATRSLADHWPDAELFWAKGGHATVLWSQKRRLTELIVRSFDRAEERALLTTALQP